MTEMPLQLRTHTIPIYNASKKIKATKGLLLQQYLAEMYDVSEHIHAALGRKHLLLAPHTTLPHCKMCSHH